LPFDLDFRVHEKGGAHRHTPMAGPQRAPARWGAGESRRYLFFAAFFLPPLAFFAIA
jgi:hypothetical protein